MYDRKISFSRAVSTCTHVYIHACAPDLIICNDNNFKIQEKVDTDNT